VLALLVSIPISLLMMVTTPALELLGQDPVVASLAGPYNLWKLPTIACFLLYSVMRQYLQGRTLMSAATWVIWLGNVVHVGLNYALIFGRLGAPALGLTGAAIASSITSALLVLGLWLWILAFGLHRMMAGWLGTREVGSHQVVLSLASMAFMVPLGIAQGASARVGNLVGAKNHAGMRLAVKVSLLLGAGVMCVSASAFTLGRFALPRLYTTDAPVIAMAASLLPIAAAFQLSDGTQVVASGLLRGMARPDGAALANLFGYYAVGLPFGYLLAFQLRLGLIGIWVGLVVGLAVVAGTLLFWVRSTARRPLGELTVANE